MILAAAFILAGVEASQSLGESKGSVLVQVGYHGPAVEVRAFANTSDKIESGGGYILGMDFDLHPEVGPLLGFGYRYRDGGAWTKRTYWTRQGVALGPVTVVLAADLFSTNAVRLVETRGRWRLGHLVLEPRIAVVHYDGAKWGWYTSMMVGVSR